MYQFPFICHLLYPNIMIKTKDTVQRGEVGSTRNLPKSLGANSEPQPGVERNFHMLVIIDGALSNVYRARAIGHLEAGWKQRDVAVLFGVSQSTISKLRLRYPQATHDVSTEYTWREHGIHMTWARNTHDVSTEYRWREGYTWRQG